MTTVLYNRVQAWFTSCMAHTTTLKRESVYDKARRILSDPSRVRAGSHASPPEFWTGEVDGDHGTYGVVAIGAEFAQRHGIDAGRLACSCRSGRFAKRLCSHMLVAEEMRRRGGVQAP